MNDQTRTEIVSRDQRRAELEQLTFSPNGQLFQPKSGRELMDMANMMSTAGFMVKDIYRNNPGACMGLIAICSPYGLNPLQVSWKSYKASKSEDAPIAFEAQVVVAMVNASGVVKGGLRYTYEGEGESRVCICSGILAGDPLPVEVRSPPLGKITPKNSPLWKSDPDQQLAYYTGRSWARRYKPEMLLGVYDVDELENPAMKDITPAAPGGFAQKAVAARAPVDTPEPQDEPVAPAESVDEPVEDAEEVVPEEPPVEDVPQEEPQRDPVAIRDGMLKALGNVETADAYRDLTMSNRWNDAHMWLLENDQPKGLEITARMDATRKSIEGDQE